LWRVAKGDLSQYEALKGMDEVEFYFILESFQEDIKKGRFNLPQMMF
jgi:hypothetical protein